MPTVLDVVEIVLEAEQFEQDVRNVFHYFIAATVGLTNILEALQAFIDEVVPTIIAVSGDTVHFTQARIKNLTDPDEFGLIEIDDNGTQSGDQYAGFVACGITLNPNSGATRPGSKRMAGVRESDALDGVLTGGGLALWDDLEPVFVASIGDTPDWGLIPIILGRLDDGGYDLSRDSGILSATVKSQLTSQTSRKIGRGA